MTSTRPFTEQTHLPALVPDLVVVGQGSHWRVERITDHLAQLQGTTARQARGHTLNTIFRKTFPDLSELARDVAAAGETVEDVRVRMTTPGGETHLMATVYPGGLTEDYKGQQVFFSFRALMPGEDRAPHQFHGIVGISSAVSDVIRKIKLYAESDASVVITGETGTGKELVARALHLESERRHGPYVVMNCAAMAEELLESELFGHEKGAFTGALRTHRGRFERAHGGSLFLDEIGDMPLHTQSKLLRVLEERRIERVGGEQEQEIDVRVLCATNIALERAVSEGRFRADLYHRIAILRILIPPLRERIEDIPFLVDHFLEMFNRKYGRVIYRVTPEALQVLQAYMWPGNIRELRNVLERVYVETRAEVIGARAFRDWIEERQSFAPGGWNLDAGVERRRNQAAVLAPWPAARGTHSLPSGGGRVFDAELVPAAADIGRNSTRRRTQSAELDEDEIRQACRAADGNLAAAARLLGVHRATLYRYMRRLGLRREDLT